MNKSTIMIMASMIAFVLAAGLGAAADAKNVTATYTGANESQEELTQVTVTAQGGNITNMSVDQHIQSRKWQGFFGNVNNSLSLSGASGTFYQWTTTGAGWVLLANSSNIDWGSLAGSGGTHTAQEDAALSMGTTDNVTATFADTNAAPIIINGITIAIGDARAVNTLSNGGADWETSLLRAGGNKIYAGLVDPDNQNYNGTLSDYQMMVPVNTATSTRTYYLFAALD